MNPSQVQRKRRGPISASGKIRRGRAGSLALAGTCGIVMIGAAALSIGGDDGSSTEAPLPERHDRATPHGAGAGSVADAPGRSAPAGGTDARPSRDAVRDRIAQAVRARHDVPVSSSGTRPDSQRAHAADEADGAPLGSLNKDYIRTTVVDDVVPLVRECYEHLLERDETTRGRVVMSFDILGDESVGGIVDGVEFLEETDLTDEGFGECVRESMASAVFEPPEGGGIVRVTYPFVFEPTDGAAAPL
jgi:hypothetical protein